MYRYTKCRLRTRNNNYSIKFVQEMRKDVAILMYKVKHHLCLKYISDLFSLNPCCYALRNADFIVPRLNTVNFDKHGIKYVGPVLSWYKTEYGR